MQKKKNIYISQCKTHFLIDNHDENLSCSLNNYEPIFIIVCHAHNYFFFYRNPPPKEVRARAEWYTKPIHISEKVRIPMDNDDMLASRYFPITLGESSSLEMLDNVRPGSCKRPIHSGSRTCSKSVERTQSANLKERASREESKRLDEMFLLTAESPFISKLKKSVAFLLPRPPLIKSPKQIRLVNCVK